MPTFDRFDIAAAWHKWLAEHHGGQWSPEYKRLSKLTGYYKPSLAESHGDLSENARAIYNRIVGNVARAAIELPEPDGGLRSTAHTIHGDVIVFVTLAHDDDCENPLTSCDGMGAIHSLNRRHVNQIEYSEAVETLNADADAVALSYYEHGLCMWMVAGDAKIPAGVEFQWDGVRFAGLWTPDDSLRDGCKDMSKAERRAQMLEYAAQACDQYTKWCNGECYGYSVEVYRVRHDDHGEPYDTLADYRRDEPLHEDSCWGFIGSDYMADVLRDDAVGNIPDDVFIETEPTETTESK